MKTTIFSLVTLMSLSLFAAPAPKTSVAPKAVETTVKPEMRIADEDLSGFEKGCLLGADQSVPKDATAQYCGCMKARFAQTISRDEYRGYNERVFASGKKTIPYTDQAFRVVEQKITDSVTACSAFLPSQPDKVIR